MKAEQKIAYLTLIIILGFALRVWGVNFGLPFLFHQDEPMMVNHAVAFGSGDFNPHYFQQPPFISYILFFIYGIYFLIGRLIGLFTSLDDFALRFIADPTSFYIIGRFFLGVIPGLLNITLVYSLYKSVLKKRGALLSALLMSVAFLNVLNSHYVYCDTLLVTFVLLTYIGLFRLYDNPTTKNYLYSAIYLGLAIGTKYNAALMALPFFLTHLFIVLNRKEKYRHIIFSRNLWVSFLAMVVTFILVNPFALLTFREFFFSFAKQTLLEWPMGWRHHLVYSAGEGMSLPVIILGIIGFLGILFKEGRRGIIFFSFPFIFYLVLVYYSQSYSRYALLLIPFIAIGFSYLIFGIIMKYLKSTALRSILIAVSIVLVLPTTVKSIRADMLLCSKDTRVISADWIKANLPLDSSIACDSTFFRPALKQPYSQIKDKVKISRKQQALIGLKEKKLKYMLETADRRGYPLYFLNASPQTQGQFFSTTPSLAFDVKQLKSGNIDYVVVNYAHTNSIKKDFLKDLKQNAKLVASFSPYYDGKIRPPYDKFATTCLAISTKEIFLRKYTGPALEIYRIKR